MTPQETAQHLRSRLSDLGYAVQPATVGSLASDVGRKRITHWPTLTSLQLFIALSPLDQSQGAEAVQQTSEALSYACKNKGGLPRGLQTGVLATSILIVPAADQASRQSVARQAPPKRWAAMSATLLVDASTNTFTTYQGTRVIGAAYNNLFARTIQEITSGLLTPTPA